jgi:hypothetical protein
VAKLLRPDGRVEMLAYDASACAPTRRLLEELEDLMRAPARAVDAAAAAAAGVVDADDFEDADDEDAPGPKNPASAYFRPRRFHAWALAAPEKYTLGAEKYRVSQGQGAGVAEKLRVTTPDDDLTNVAARDPYRNAAGLAVSGDAHSPSATTDVVALDPEVDEETALIVQRARAAKVRALADAARRRAMSRNPADVLRSTTRAGGDHAFDPMTLRSYDSGRASSETRDRGSSEKPVVTRAALDRFALDVVSASPVFDADAARAKTRKLVPRLPAEALAAARDDAAAYDARLDARAAETRARAPRAARSCRTPRWTPRSAPPGTKRAWRTCRSSRRSRWKSRGAKGEKPFGRVSTPTRVRRANRRAQKLSAGFAQPAESERNKRLRLRRSRRAVRRRRERERRAGRRARGGRARDRVGDHRAAAVGRGPPPREAAAVRKHGVVTRKRF